VRVAALLLFLAAAGAAAAGDALALALADARALPPDARPHVRYLELPGSLPERARAEFLKVLAFHVNSLSREAAFAPPAGHPAPVLASPTLARVYLPDYGWDSKVYERLGPLDPYYHVKVRTTEFEEVDELQTVGRYYLGGRPVRPGTPGAVWVDEGKEPTGRKIKRPKGGARAKDVTAAAPWLDAAAIAELVALTQSQVPLLRADWFFVQTARELDREDVKTNAGYYEFLGIASRGDILRLTGLDEKVSRRIQREVAAIV